MTLQIAPFLQAVVVNDGSDLHIKVGSPPRIRISGALVPLEVSPFTVEGAEAMIRETMSADIRAHFETTNEADYALSVPGIGRFRVNAFRSRGAAGCVLRLVRHTPVSLEELGLPDVIRRLALETRGLVLVTGPTGSGKTTTLSAMVDAINEARAVHILTIEDPIEVVHQDKLASVTQRELGTDTADWSVAMRAAMRQDPDVILIGEMRDTETVRAALSAAETGHLVMSTLHTTDAKETVNRIIDFFPPHEQKQVRLALATSLRGIVCQRLVPRADGDGRAVAMEIAVNNPRIAEAVADPHKTDTIEEIIAAGTYDGTQTFDQHLVRMVLEGAVSLRDAKLFSSNSHDMSVMLKRAGFDPALVDEAVCEHAMCPAFETDPRRRSVVSTMPSAELAGLDLEQLRAYRSELEGEEDRVSYWRRLVHARIDVLEAESGTGNQLTPEELIRVLGDTGSGRTRRALVRFRAADPLPDLPVLSEMWVTEVDPQDAGQVEDALSRLRTAEQQLTTYRRALHDHIDDATRELILRYRENPLAALSVIPQE